jgi:TolB-like protein
MVRLLKRLKPQSKLRWLKTRQGRKRHDLYLDLLAARFIFTPPIERQLLLSPKRRTIHAAEVAMELDRRMMESPGRDLMTTSNPADRLDSWKEIAAFMRRDVRTVQRWEKKEGLPVYRHQHDKLGSIYAFRAELQEWFGSRQQSSPAANSDKIKLAVLPFQNLSGDVEDAYFSDGLTEEMTTQVTRLQPAELAVVARSTAEHYDSTRKSLDQMKRDLGVDYVLEGKVRRAEKRVRITARLSEVQDQTQMWAETYERDLSDVLGVQAEIAQAIGVEPF